MFHVNCLHIPNQPSQQSEATQIGSRGPLSAAKSGPPILVAKFGPARTSFGKRGPSLTNKSGLGGSFLAAKIGPRDHFWVGPIFACF